MTAARPAGCGATSTSRRPATSAPAWWRWPRTSRSWANMFQHRFSRGELAGHNLGNLFLAALTELAGSFDEAVALTSHALAIAGEVLPATREPAVLVAEMEDGRVVAGESAVASDRSRVRRLRLEPPHAEAHSGAVTAIERADLIVLGPGSLFTSTLPPLLVPEHPRRRAGGLGAPRLRRQPPPAAGRDDRLRRREAPRPARPARRLGHRRHGARAARPAPLDRPDPGRLRPRASCASAAVEVVAAHITDGPPPRSGRARARRWCARPAGRSPARELLGGRARGARVRAAAGRALLPAARCCRPRPHRRLVPPARARRGARRGGAAAGTRRRGAPWSCCALLGATCEIRTHRERALPSGQQRRSCCAGDDRTLQVLHEAGVLSASPRRRRGRRRGSWRARCCRGAYLRGAFLAAGTVARRGGRRTSRSATHDAAAAAFLARVAARDEIALARARAPVARGRVHEALGDARGPARAHRRRRAACCGWRRARSCLAGPQDDANRQANAETANLRRQVVAARRAAGRDRRCSTSLASCRRELAAAAARCGSSTLSCRWRSWPRSATVLEGRRWPVALRRQSRRSPTSSTGSATARIAVGSAP